ncbi:MAG: mechanosensitive ion channel [Deltaproteobacteria bacterium]|jgi:small-conductance mechanosensitive channel|nr:mechanosensitive ion channel [Deltaproteobacteria bacterium]
MRKFLVLVLFIVLTGGIWPGLLFGQSKPGASENTPASAAPAEAELAEGSENIVDPPAPVKADEQLWRNRAADLIGLASEADSVLAEAKQTADSFDQQLTNVQNQFAHLQRIYGISRGHPSEQEDILGQLRALKRELELEVDPLTVSLAELNQRLDEVRSIQDSMENQSSHESQEDSGDGLVNSYKKNLQLAKSQMEAAVAGLEAILEPGQAALKLIGDFVAEIEAELPKTWHDYYSAGAGTSGVARTHQDLFKWAASLKSRAMFIYPQTGTDWSGALVRFLITVAVTTLLGSLVLKGMPLVPVRWRPVLTSVIKGPGLWMALGLSLLAASASSFGGSYFVFKLPGILILVQGLATLSWRLRETTNPMVAGTSSPLARLYKPAAVGVILLFVDMPAGAVSIVWVVTLVVFIYYLRKRPPVKPDGQGLKLPERIASSGIPLFVAASLLIGLAGYSRLAILVYMGLYALVNILILGGALVILAAEACRRLYDPEVSPVKHAILHSLAVPASSLVSLVCALPWLWAVPGSSPLLSNLMTKGYTVGDASFDFSRIIFIIMLFLLFRSLKGLGMTSLAHLPDTMPNIERGLIPPLQSLLTYLLWGIFAVVALGMVGVNFSSLAVVLGGLSVGVGFGLQNLINNLVSGFTLIFGRTILVGDWVEVGGISGYVVSVNIRCTVVETSANSQVFVPNSVIMGGQVTNWTRNNRLCRQKVNFNLVYGSDVDEVIRLMLKVAEDNPDVRKVPLPTSVAISDLTDTAMIFTLTATVSVDMAAGIAAQLRQDIYKIFYENGIKFYTRTLEVSLPDQTLKVTT